MGEKKIAVVTDSVAALPREVCADLEVHTVPILIYWDGQTYRDGVDLTPSEVYQRLRRSVTLPTSSAPTVGDFVQLYTRLSKEADGIVSVHVSSKLSATYEAASVAARAVEPVVPIRVVDSGTAAMGQGFAVLAAVRAAKEGADLQETAQVAERVARRSLVLAVLDTLKYVARSGRVNRKVMLAANALRIKPILCLHDHRVALLARPRTKRKAILRMLEEVKKRAQGRPIHVAVMHADAPEEAEKLRAEIEANFNCAELHLTEFTPVMGTMAGPGLVGLAFYVDQEQPEAKGAAKIRQAPSGAVT